MLVFSVILFFHYIVHVVALPLQVHDVLSYGAIVSSAPLFFLVIVIALGDILPPLFIVHSF